MYSNGNVGQGTSRALADDCMLSVSSQQHFQQLRPRPMVSTSMFSPHLEKKNNDKDNNG